MVLACQMATMERLWRTYSDGKFGFAVQHKAFESKKCDRDFEKFFDRIGWKNKEGSLLRWLPEAKGDEFIYDLEKAPKGHLPLTSALRGTRLLEGLLDHPAWETEGEHPCAIVSSNAVTARAPSRCPCVMPFSLPSLPHPSLHAEFAEITF